MIGAAIVFFCVVLALLWPGGKSGNQPREQNGGSPGAGTVGGNGDHWVDYTADEWQAREDFYRLDANRRKAAQDTDRSIHTDDSYFQRHEIHGNDRLKY